MSTRAENDYYWSDEKEPHVLRRREILKAHPEIKELFGTNPMLAVTSTFWVAVQVFVALNIHRLFDPALGLATWQAWLAFIAITYIIGGTIAHALFLAVHEITHYMAFEAKWANNVLSFVAQIPILFPYAMSFQYYHGIHHWSQGKDGDDADIPLQGEAKLFTGFMGKFVWYINQIFFYALRPMFVKKLPITKWSVANMIFTFTTSGLLIYFTAGIGNGFYGLFFLALALVFAGGLHPSSGHFISEHYVFEEGQETYSYYGPLNLVNYNVGYHNEHHDFPNIPGRRLPQVRKIAPEFYDNLKSYDSWVGVIWKFLTTKEVTLYSRTKRKI
ncbi:MAG: fatty acid desaturase [Chitinophagales bacterium]